jgi:hypothetical protein
MPFHAQRVASSASAGEGVPARSGAAGGLGSKYRGKKKALATSVGSTALPITFAMRKEYCV